MKLASFSVENYRSITQARQIPLSDSTVLIGPNNEGKSNILRALNVAMVTLTAHAKGRQAFPGARLRRRSRLHYNEYYDPAIDAPITDNKKKMETRITLEFELTSDEIEDFKSELKSAINGILIIKITFKSETTDIKVVKNGRGSLSLNAKIQRILKFILNRIQFQYIPSIRTAEHSTNIVRDIVSTALVALERDEAYKNALEEIKRLQKPILDSLSKKTTDTLRQFLPDVKKVKFSISDERRYTTLSQTIDIDVDDGIITNLEAKGDGVQSLIALGLRRHVLEEERDRKTYIFAIEEPEAHLHSEAIYGLRNVINNMSNLDQVIITTHSGILANRDSIGSNIIVNKTKASPANKLSDIRSALGIRSYDNLLNADVILLVEGENDKTALTSILKWHSDPIRNAMDSGRMIIDSIDGAGGLCSKISLYRSILCQIHCFLDYDLSGRQSIEKAKTYNLISDNDYNLTLLSARNESEFEDFINPGIYYNIFMDNYSIDLKTIKPRTKGKWSVRMADIFTQCGKPFDNATKQQAKYSISEACAANPGEAIATHAQSVIDALIGTLTQKLRVT
ncbi:MULTISPECIES: ATP-binding protein [unclassified Xanthobacter]|uniref:ATP-dependent nuclease n=1 Tax=unclassified Xanthobacter TaxID=2623496 RepID=UPI001F1F8091